MIQKLKSFISFIRKIDFRQFVYLNYVCDSVHRIDGSRIIPYRCAVIDLSLGAKIFLCGGDLEIGCNKLKGSKAETRIRLHPNAIWSSQGGGKISYGVTLEILSGALLDSRYFTMNSNSVMIVSRKIDLGEDVMIARNVVIYDSDYHTILDVESNVKNYPEPVIIDDHVWIGTNATILKGTHIGKDSIIGAGSMICGEVKSNVTYATKKNDGVSHVCYGWEREAPVNNRKEMLK